MPISASEHRNKKIFKWLLPFSDLLILLFIFFALLVLTRDNERTVNLYFTDSSVSDPCEANKRPEKGNFKSVTEGQINHIYLYAHLSHSDQKKDIIVPYYIDDGEQEYFKNGQRIKDYKLFENGHEIEEHQREGKLIIPAKKRCASTQIRIVDDPFLEPKEERLRIEVDRNKLEEFNLAPNEKKIKESVPTVLVKAGDHSFLTVAIEDDDLEPTVSLVLKSFEGKPGDTIRLVAELSELVQDEVRLKINFSGSAVINRDYTVSDEFIVFKPGIVKSQITISINKSIKELPKTVDIQIEKSSKPVVLESVFNRSIRIIPKEEILLKDCGAIKSHMQANKDLFQTAFMLFRDKTRCLISLPEELFEEGSIKIKNQNQIRQFVKNLVPIIHKNYPGDLVIIAGHTDDTAYGNNKPLENYYIACRDPKNKHLIESRNKTNLQLCNNWELSAMRASVVAIVLLEEGLDKKKVAVEGRSDNLPNPSDKKRLQKAIHRRVEIVIMDPPADPQDMILEYDATKD